MQYNRPVHNISGKIHRGISASSKRGKQMKRVINSLIFINICLFRRSGVLSGISLDYLGEPLDENVELTAGNRKITAFYRLARFMQLVLYN